MNKTTEKIGNIHTSVLLAESISYLDVKTNGLYIDATLGLGGHSEAILGSAEGTKVIGIDQDLEAIGFAGKRLKQFGDRITIFHDNFAEIRNVAEKAKVKGADGIIADLGVSSLQFDSETRGFSFRFDAPLDMRMNADSDSETAAELLQRLSEEEIANIIYEYGEERFSRRIARRIIERRQKGDPVRTTGDLAELVKYAVPKRSKDKIHPATKTFQALRIAVNNELEILESFIKESIDLLKTNGRFVVITFHSLEDRIVKRTFQTLSGKCSCPPRLPVCICGAEKKIQILTRKPVVPTEKETIENSRARSAKLRACLKL
ncbi:MAG: 16S rRNA (cytosine(1402)-N(4))-methyltransferase RsmH [Pyrinomonadaceae bacterium]